MNIKQHTRRSTLALCIAVGTLMMTADTAEAHGLQSEMDKLFGQMSNTTPPGVYESQRRGVLAGGRVTGKAKSSGPGTTDPWITANAGRTIQNDTGTGPAKVFSKYPAASASISAAG